jgi:xanthine dehydrogenase YagT iron-sulfur-binding subunit
MLSQPKLVQPTLVRLTINGDVRELLIEARVSLLDALRERLGLTGTRKGCDHGQCVLARFISTAAASFRA